jgi:HAE1 family hydrophobic/amphiphilic exporter-1
VLKYTGKYNTTAGYENMVIKSNEAGNITRLKDIAEVEFWLAGI